MQQKVVRVVFALIMVILAIIIGNIQSNNPEFY